MEKLYHFLLWSTLINFGLLLWTTMMLLLLGDRIVAVHQKFFDLEPAKLQELYFQFIGNYKIFIIMFNLVPLIVLAFCKLS